MKQIRTDGAYWIAVAGSVSVVFVNSNNSFVAAAFASEISAYSYLVRSPKPASSSGSPRCIEQTFIFNFSHSSAVWTKNSWCGLYVFRAPSLSMLDVETRQDPNSQRRGSGWPAYAQFSGRSIRAGK